jgi:hypothetical protein
MLTQAQLIEKYSNPALVAELIKRKVADGEARSHPEFPTNDEMMLYRCWDSTTYDSDDEVSESTTMVGNAELDKQGAMNLCKSGVFDKVNVDNRPDRKDHTLRI